MIRTRVTMTKTEYGKEQNRILRAYDRQRRQLGQSSAEMQLAILREKNKRMAELAERYQASHKIVEEDEHD